MAITDLARRLAHLEANSVRLTREELAALSDEDLAAYAARLEAALPPAERERTRAWLASATDADLAAVIRRGRL